MGHITNRRVDTLPLQLPPGGFTPDPRSGPVFENRTTARPVRQPYSFSPIGIPDAPPGTRPQLGAQQPNSIVDDIRRLLFRRLNQLDSFSSSVLSPIHAAMGLTDTFIENNAFSTGLTPVREPTPSRNR